MKQLKLYAFADEAGASMKQQIAAMQRNGLDGLEIRGTDWGNVSGLTSAQAGEIKAMMDDAGLEVWSIGSPIGKISITGDDWDAHLDVFRRTLETASILGAGNIRLFSFYLPKGQYPAAFRGCVIDRMNTFVETAAGTGIRLCHENEKGIYGDTAPRCLDLLENVPGLCAIFDPANFVQCGQDTLEAWKLLGSRIAYMHIKDALTDGRVVPSGEGNGHLPEILREYVGTGGTAMTVEPHLFDFAGLAALEKNGDRSVVGDGHYASPDAAFDAAVDALKSVLRKL